MYEHRKLPILSPHFVFLIVLTSLLSFYCHLCCSLFFSLCISVQKTAHQACGPSCRLILLSLLMILNQKLSFMLVAVFSLSRVPGTHWCSEYCPAQSDDPQAAQKDTRAQVLSTLAWCCHKAGLLCLGCHMRSQPAEHEQMGIHHTAVSQSFYCASEARKEGGLDVIKCVFITSKHIVCSLSMKQRSPLYSHCFP